MSCHRFVAASIVALACLAPEPALSKESGSSTRTWYAQTIARDPGGLYVTDLWARGPALRAETVRGGHRIVTIVAGEWYYVYDLVGGKGLAIRRDPRAVAEDAKRRRPFGNEYDALLEEGAEQVARDESLGFPSAVYRITDAQGKRELRVSIDEDRLPLRFELYDRSRGSQRTTDYVGWKRNLELREGFFEPPADASFDRLELDEYLELSSRGALPLPVLHGSLLAWRER